MIQQDLSEIRRCTQSALEALEKYEKECDLLAKLLLKFRLAAQIPQSELANRIGVDIAYVSKAERGLLPPRRSFIAGLSRYLESFDDE